MCGRGDHLGGAAGHVSGWLIPLALLLESPLPSISRQRSSGCSAPFAPIPFRGNPPDDPIEVPRL